MVYFVGAGSGAPDLITVRGKNLLEKADMIIYAGSLVNPELLQYAKAGCELHNSAKLTLEEIKSMVPEEWVMRILEVGGVTTDFRSVWLLVFWGRLTRG